MKKLLFFRSSSGGNNTGSPPSADKQLYWENPLGSGVNDQAGENNSRGSRGFFGKSRKQQSDSQSCSSNSGLRRSRSLSSAAFFVDGMGQKNFPCTSDRSRSPASRNSGALSHRCNHSSRHSKVPTPEKQSREKQFEVATIQSAQRLERLGSSASSRTYHDSSGSSSLCSSNVSTKIVDRYIDGEQHLERSKFTNSSSQANHTGNGNGEGRLPPRVQYVIPTSPTDSAKGKPKSHSFRESKGTCLHFSSRDWVENGFGHESPRRLAKNVVERLSQTHFLPRSSSKEFDYDIPITIEDIYGGSFSRHSDSNSDVVAQKSNSLDEPYETVNGFYRDDISGLQKQNCFFGDTCEGSNSTEIEEDVEVDLQRRCKEAEERVMVLSEELEQETFICNSGFDVPKLIQTIRSLSEDKLSLAHEISGLLQSRIAERASSKEELKQVKSDLESQTRRLEKEKNELQLVLEKELDRRSSDWSLKLEKYQMEEQRLRERVRELAEQNVSLQREVSSLNEKETESRRMVTYSEQQLKDLNTRIEGYNEDNQDLRQNLSHVQEKYRAAEEDLDCIKRNFEDKEMECKELQKSITRLLRRCSEQEKTIAGFQEEFNKEIGNKQSVEEFDKHVAKLQMEQMRLTGVELSLRREVESYRLEVDSLRHENINLLHRLKANGKESDALTIKLDNELWTRICCLQNQGLSMLNESTQLCCHLLEFIKGKAGKLQETEQGMEFIKNGLDGQFIVESDMKVQSLKRGIESLTRSLQTLSALLNEKSSLVALKPLHTDADCSGKLNNQTPEENIRSELRAETLLTSLLREKLYSKELEVEQLQAELATAVRGNDILRCEVQNAMDNLSCATHKLKDLEIQMLKKDENISHLQRNLQDSAKELKIMKGILPKVSEERDLMWEEVKQYSEKNMLLNSEVNVLKKKIESLEEDILLKEGQIAILKDTLGNKRFDLLASPDSMQEFLLN